MSKSRSIAPVKKTAADLQRYETMCRAIEAAKKADEVVAIHDEARALRAAARVANNREAEADLHVIRRRARPTTDHSPQSARIRSWCVREASRPDQEKCHG
jgi:2-C-methyl-D-erythritol 4-phosphate cytidylyltransferase